MKKSREDFRLCAEFDPEAYASSSDNFSKGTKELMSEAQKELAEEEQKRKKEEMKLQLAINDFDQAAATIMFRRDKAINDADKKELKSRTALNADFAENGGEVKELREKLRENEIIRQKEKDAAYSVYNAAIANLKKRNPEGYRNSSRRYDY